MPELDLASHARFDMLRNRLEVSGTLIAQTALRIGRGRTDSIEGSDLPVLRDGQGRIFIPGASLKGAFRSRLESLVRAASPQTEPSFNGLKQLREALQRAKDDAERDALLATARPAGPALDLLQIEKRTAAVRELIGANPQLTEAQRSRMLLRQSNLVDLTFGSPELAGRLFFRDAPVSLELAAERVEVRNGVAINRDTETVEGSLLYNYEVVPAGTPFVFALTMENAADWQLGMVLRALTPWVRGDLQLGGFRTRGLGYVKLEGASASYTPIDNVDAVLSLIGVGKQRNTTRIPLAVLVDSGEKDEELLKSLDETWNAEALKQARTELLRWTEAFRMALIGQEVQEEQGDA